MQDKSPYQLLGFLALGVYFIYCGVYFIERVCYADSAHMLFKMIQSGSFNIEAGRYPQILTQIPVILALKWKISLKAVAFIYSISFPLFFGAAALVSYTVYKNRWAPALLVFALTGTVNYSFFHCATETHQSIAWGLLFYSWILSPVAVFERSPQYLIQLLWGALFAVLSMHAHPVGFFFIIFSLGYYIAQRKDFKNPAVYFVFILIAVLSLYKTAQTEATSYEGQFLSVIPEFPKLLGDFGNNWTREYFFNELNHTYLFLWTIFVLALAGMLRRRMFLRASYYLLFNVGLLIFTMLIYHKGDSYVMMERAFMPLAFTVAAPAMELICVSKKTRNNLIQALAIIIVFMVGFGRISEKAMFMDERLAYMNKLHQKYSAPKICLKTSQVDMQLIEVPWPVCFESLLYSSAVYGKDSCFTISVMSEEEFEAADLSSPDNFITPGFFGSLKTTELNQQFFKIPPQPYVAEVE
ncbi:MAG: hypothetical protein R2850_03580 [Bacteroidia bacterium]